VKSNTDEGKATRPETFLAGGGEMGERIRALDWSKTALGPIETWPAPLRTCVRIVLTSKQPMFVWWGEQFINLYNDAYKTIVGGKHPAALGQPASVVWREIWPVVEPRALSALRDNEGTYDEALLLIMERNGYPEETYYTFSYSPVPSEQAGPGGVLCANTEDTRRILGERQLTLLRELASKIAEARTPEEACTRAAKALSTSNKDVPFAAIYLVDADRHWLSLSAVCGIEPGGALTPKRIAIDATSPLPIADAMAQSRAVVVGELGARIGALPTGGWQEPPRNVAVVPIMAPLESGHRGVLLVGLNPFRLFDDDYRGFLELVAGQLAAGIANAEAYEREKRRSEALAELDRAKTAFFSNVSHEFRTPLTLILGPIEDARDGAQSLSPENLETVYRNSVRLMRLVNALLDFSRIEAGRTVASYEPTDLSALVQNLASAFRSAIERAGLRFELELPPLGEPVFLDHDMWEKIVLNLLSNALKFTFDGAISVKLQKLDGRVELVIADTGSGIPEKDLPHVFERFHRVEGARARTNEGSGIGLALVNELVKLHGGIASVKSTVGAGTAITISVPLGSAHLPEECVRKKSEAPGGVRSAAAFVLEAERWLPTRNEAELEPVPSSLTAADTTAGAHILLADDNADMRDYLARLLRQRWTVEAVGDGKAAIAAVARRRPDLVLSDVMMPHLDGFDLLTALKSERETRGIPVVLLSARAGEESRIEGLEAGADDYLVKPFSARELMARVATHLQIASLRHAAEAERARLFDVLEQAPVPVAVFVGDELRFELANPPYCEMVGRTALVGRPLREALPEIGDHPVIASLETALATGQSLRVTEFRVPVLRRGAVTEAYFDYVVQPLRGASEAVAGIILVANEVTEQVVARRRVDDLRAAAENASRAKDEFLSTLSHELRTPLNAIVGWSSLLSSGAIPAAQVPRAVETIERNARVQARLIDDMLDLSRIEQGKLVLSVGPLEMVRIVEAAIDAVRPAADAKGVRLQPVLDSHATIVGDADRLQQVVWNLLSNAIKFTTRGGRVHIRLRRDQSHVEVVVADTGQGIEPDFLPHVFERFRQSDGGFTRKAGGLGLGLAIVRSLVELHGGNVTAESDGKDRGATFVVRLPMAPLRASGSFPPAEPGEREQSSPPTFECPPELANLRILVVDDEPATRELLQFVLEQCDAKVTTVASAAEALAAFAEYTFDVLISDIGMPDVDGYSLIRSVRALAPDGGGRVPALALTAYARGEDRTQALKSGFNMHLTKPIDPTELLVVIAALVNGYQRSLPD
jgi:signal transduction histidine kinase